MNKSPQFKEGRGEFIRKGEVGDWINHFDEVTNNTWNAWILENLERLGISEEYLRKLFQTDLWIEEWKINIIFHIEFLEQISISSHNTSNHHMEFDHCFDLVTLTPCMMHASLYVYYNNKIYVCVISMWKEGRICVKVLHNTALAISNCVLKVVYIKQNNLISLILSVYPLSGSYNIHLYDQLW